MVVYHGSNSNFKKLRVSNSLVKYDSTKGNEGAGIYFSLNKDVAASYGKYLYTLEINNKYLLDFRSIKTCRSFIHDLRQNLLQRFRFDLYCYCDAELLCKYMYYGGISIANLDREIGLVFDSNEAWFYLSESKRNSVMSGIRGYLKKNLHAYLFTYHISGVGVIKDVSDSVVRIIGKERR